MPSTGGIYQHANQQKDINLEALALYIGSKNHNPKLFKKYIYFDSFQMADNYGTTTVELHRQEVHNLRTTKARSGGGGAGLTHGS